MTDTPTEQHARLLALVDEFVATWGHPATDAEREQAATSTGFALWLSERVGAYWREDGQYHTLVAPLGGEELRLLQVHRDYADEFGLAWHCEPLADAIPALIVLCLPER